MVMADSRSDTGRRFRFASRGYGEISRDGRFVVLAFKMGCCVGHAVQVLERTPPPPAPPLRLPPGVVVDGSSGRVRDRSIHASHRVPVLLLARTPRDLYRASPVTLSTLLINPGNVHTEFSILLSVGTYLLTRPGRLEG